MEERLEVLVHVSAPSNTENNARYRREASSLLEFKATKRHNILVTTAAGSILNSPKDSNLQIKSSRAEIDALTVTIPIVAEQTPLSAAKCMKALVQQDLIVSAGVQVTRTPLLKWSETAPARMMNTMRNATSDISRHSQSDSWETPPSVIPDSQPSEPDTNNGIRGKDSSQLGGLIGSSTVSRHRGNAPIVYDILPQASFDSSNIDPNATKGYSQSMSNKNILLLPTLDVPRFAATHFSSPPFLEEVKSFSPSSSLTEPSQPYLKTIRAPVPETSEITFTTHLTESLNVLASNPHLLQLYRPVEVTRQLRTFERGYWRLTLMDSWDVTVKNNFWTFLEEFVGGGRAGWGIWAEWLLKENEILEQDDRKSSVADREVEQDVVKVFCWGEIVREIWMVLFLGSNRHINSSQAVWIDAGEELVVRMS